MNEGGGRPFVRSIESGETVSEAVVLAVSEATGRPPAPIDEGTLDELDELFDSVDPDALDALFRGDSNGSVVFYWSGYEVEIDSGKHVIVTPLS